MSKLKKGVPLPFNLLEIQKYANDKFEMTSKEVFNICQSLYEKKLQTYPKTDCQFLPECEFENASMILNHIAQNQPDLVCSVLGANVFLKSKAWNNNKIGEHVGLISTKQQADMSLLSDGEKKIYQIVCERYIAQFYPAYVFDNEKRVEN